METELFDRYIREVGRRLPRRQRADIEGELLSLLLDALHSRVRDGDDADAIRAHEIEILEEFGPPAEVAGKYSPQKRRLVGPRLFDLYLLIAGLVVGCQTFLHLFALVLMVLGESGPSVELPASIGELLGEYVGSVLASFGFITLLFAVLDRVVPESYSGEEESEEVWNPRDLPEVEDRTSINIQDRVAETALFAVLLIVLNFFPRWVGVYTTCSVDGEPMEPGLIPILSPAFFDHYLPLLNVSFVVAIALNVVLLRQRRWRRLTRLIDFFNESYAVFILYQMLTGPSPVAFLDCLVNLGLALGLIAVAFSAISKLSLVLRKDWPDADLAETAKPE